MTCTFLANCAIASKLLLWIVCSSWSCSTDKTDVGKIKMILFDRNTISKIQKWTACIWFEGFFDSWEGMNLFQTFPPKQDHHHWYFLNSALWPWWFVLAFKFIFTELLTAEKQTTRCNKDKFRATAKWYLRVKQTLLWLICIIWSNVAHSDCSEQSITGTIWTEYKTSHDSCLHSGFWPLPVETKQNEADQNTLNGTNPLMSYTNTLGSLCADLQKQTSSALFPINLSD